MHTIKERDFLTIREAAGLLHISHDRIRAWQKQGLVPGFFAGTRFYVNYPRFKEQLEAGKIGARPQGGGDPAQSKEGDGAAARG